MHTLRGYSLAILMLTVTFVSVPLSQVSAAEEKMKKDDGYVKRTEAKIQRLEGRIEELRENVKDHKEDSSLRKRLTDNLDQLGAELAVQMEKLKEAGSDTLGGIRENIDGAVSNVDNMVQDAQRNYYQWQAERRLQGYIADMENLKRGVSEKSEDLKNRLSANTLTINSKVEKAKENIKKLGEASADTWFDLKQDVEQSLDEVEISSRYLSQKVYVWKAKERLAEMEAFLKNTDAAKNVKEGAADLKAELKGQIRETKSVLNDLSMAENDTWDSVKASLEKTMDKAQNTFDRLKS